MTAAGAWVHDRLTELGGWRRSSDLLAGITKDDLTLLGYRFDRLLPPPFRPDVATRGYAGRRIAMHLRYLRGEGLVEQRIRVEETRSGGLVPIGEWRAL